MSAATILLIIMWIFAAVFFVVLVRDVLAHKDELDKTKLGYNSIISMIANFLILWASEAMLSPHQRGNLTSLSGTT